MNRLVTAMVALLAATGAKAAVELSPTTSSLPETVSAALTPPVAAPQAAPFDGDQYGVELFGTRLDFSARSAGLAALATAGVGAAGLIGARRRKRAKLAEQPRSIAPRGLAATVSPSVAATAPASDVSLPTYGIFAERARTLRADAPARGAPVALPQWARFGAAEDGSHRA